MNNKQHQLESTLQKLKDLKEELSNYNAPKNLNGWSLSNLPHHFWETFGECINDIERYKDLVGNKAGYNVSPKPISSEGNPPTYSIPIYENGIKTEWTVYGVVGDEKYFKLLELGNGKDLPDMINTKTKQ